MLLRKLFCRVSQPFLEFDIVLVIPWENPLHAGNVETISSKNVKSFCVR